MTAEETSTQREFERLRPVEDFIQIVLRADGLTDYEKTLIAGNLRGFYSHLLEAGGRIRVLPHAGRRGYDMAHDPVRDVIVVDGVAASTDVLRMILVEPQSGRWIQCERNGETVCVRTMTGSVARDDVDEVVTELERAHRHGDKFASLHEAYAVILEELDEIWEITRQKRRERNGEELRKEFIQLGAMALKALVSLENFTGGSV